jgi:hypothetical protein
MSNTVEQTYLILAYNYLNDKSDYMYCDDKNQLRNKCNELKDDGFDIMFAGKIVIAEDYTVELR